MKPDEERLRATVERASQLVEGLPTHIASALAPEVFRAIYVPTAGPEQSRGQVRTEHAPGMALGEMVASLGRRTNAELLLAFAVHMFRSGRLETMSSEDFVNAYREVRLGRPENLSDTVAKAVRRGWLIPAPDREGKRTWRASQRGHEEFDRWLI